MSSKIHEYKGDKNYRNEFYNNPELHTKPIFKPSTSGKCQVIDFHVIQMFQEIITIGLWSPVASIVFTSSLLPIKSTNTSPLEFLQTRQLETLYHHQDKQI